MRTGICGCGCGQQVIAKGKGPIPKWLPGHTPATLCECGCGGEIVQKRTRKLARFLPGHTKRKLTTPRLPDLTSGNTRTAREQSRKLIDNSRCQMEHIGGCRGRIETHHKDKNPLNRELSNLMAVCRSHHRLLDAGTITPDSTEMPQWYEGRDGKRRYVHTNPGALEWKPRKLRRRRTK